MGQLDGSAADLLMSWRSSAKASLSLGRALVAHPRQVRPRQSPERGNLSSDLQLLFGERGIVAFLEIMMMS
jgi:hypothetical protein